MRNGLEIVDGAAAGAWIEPRLGGAFGAVTLQVPKGYEAYARILHPASDLEGNSVRWSEVAKAMGTTMHPEVQWHALLGLSGPEKLRVSYRPGTAVGSKWVGCDPPIGGLDPETLGSLYEVLNTYTACADECYFGFCTIEGALESFSADELKPLLELPFDRDYVALFGSLLSCHDPAQFDWVNFEAPNLIWPADHSWLVASEVDFDSTLVGGSVELVQAILNCSKFEAWQVKPTDSLAADADKVNEPSQ